MRNQTRIIAILLGMSFLQTSHCQIQRLSSSSFYPLGIGDRWEYDDYAWGSVGVWDTLVINIDKDTSFGGHTYFVRSGRSNRYGNSWRDFQRVDSSGDVLRGDPSTLSESLMYRLSDTSKSWWLVGGDPQRFDSCAIKTLYGAPRSMLYVGDYKIQQSDTNLIGARVLIDGIGWYTSYVVIGDIGGTFLRGARINGTIIGDITDVREDHEADLVIGFRLEPAYPNPFNPKTVVSGQWTVTSEVRLIVYDVLGRKVATLADGRYPAGKYSFTFDGRNFASGIYFCRLIAGDHLSTTKMILEK